MNSTNTFILILFLCFQYSCNSNLQKEYVVDESKFKIIIPKSFTQISSQEVNKFYESGREMFEQNGYKSQDNQESIFFYRKGEFSILKAKIYELDQNIINDYKNHWNNMKDTLFNVLVNLANEMDEATIDSLSRIEKINGIKFYVFETNIYLLDLNKTHVNLKSLRYSTPIGNKDLVLDASFINQEDGIAINESLKSIRFKK